MTPLAVDRRRKTIYLLFAAPLLLWFWALLHVLRLSTGFNFLIKHLGPVLIFGTMTLCPLAAAWLGWRMCRRKESPALARAAFFGGIFLVCAFVAYPGIPLVKKWMAPSTPRNPGQPSPLPLMSGLPVFPGAEGFGTRTPAGRGGKLIEVTSLSDHGPGSLRAALEDSAPRTIVFRVSGIIELERSIIVAHPYFTVAGQTAPGDGICLKNASLVIATHDALVQHLRIRPGNEGKVEPDDNDAVTILGRVKAGAGASNVVLDHVSASWGEDETVSTWFGAHDITISWCIVSEALNKSRHHKGTHSAGLLVGDASDHVSIHHTLLAHNGFRNPLISKGGTHDVVNNVIYNWSEIGAEVFDIDSNSFLNFVGNHFQPGPSTPQGLFEITINSKGTPKIFVEANAGPHLTGEEPWSLVSFKWNQKIAPAHYRSLSRFESWPIKATSAAEAFSSVLANAGATKPKRDPVDARVVADVTNGKGRIINSPAEVGGYPKLKSAPAPLDSDHDGIPDEWEIAHGLDPKNPADANVSAKEGGYTHLEEYLHSLSSTEGNK